MNESENRPPDLIHFGTDGWRAVIGDGFTYSNLERVSQAYAEYIASDPSRDPAEAKWSPRPLIIIGYDQRFLSPEFAGRVSEIMAGNNFDTLLFDQAVPTPLVSWAVRELQSAGGIVITASHNPPEFNGFKIKAPWGGSAPREITDAVEACIDLEVPKRAKVLEDDKNELIESVTASYRQQLIKYVDLDRMRFADHRVVADAMHGSAGVWVESFISGGKLQTETIRSTRDPLFGDVNPEPIDHNLGALKNRVTETGALLGLATDGDADRLGAVNEKGEAMTMHEVVPLLLLHLIRQRQMFGGVVTTFSQSVLVKRIASSHGILVFETPIGFKYIADLMLSEDILMGAEESGGIGLKGHLPDRDGILNSLLLLEAVVFGGKPPSELIRDIRREFGEFYFGRRDIEMGVGEGQDLARSIAFDPPASVAKHKVSNVETLDGTKLVFPDESWLLFRQSGTEPLLRIYSEATSMPKLNDLLDWAISITHQSRG